MSDMVLYDDFVCRFLFEGLDVRGALVRLGPAWQAMQQGRDYPPAAAMLLGEMTAVTALIACQLKQPGRMTFQLKGSDPVSLLVVDCDEQLRLRGMVRARGMIGDEKTVPALLGDGQLVLTLDVASAREPYQSIVPLQGETVGEVFEHYLTQSEQQDTRLHLVSTPEACAGLFVRRLPASTESGDPDGWNRISRLAATVRPEEMVTLSPAVLLHRLFYEENVRLFPARALTYHCPYDRQKVISTLRALGRDEMLRLVEEQGEIAVHDEICNHHYRFDKADVIAMFESPPQGTH